MSVPSIAQSFREREDKVDEITADLLNRLPSVFFIDIDSGNYAVHLRTLAREFVLAEEDSLKVERDVVLDTARGVLLGRNFGYVLDFFRARSRSVEEYRGFLRGLFRIFIQGSIPQSFIDGAALFTDAETRVVEFKDLIDFRDAEDIQTWVNNPFRVLNGKGDSIDDSEAAAFTLNDGVPAPFGGVTLADRFRFRILFIIPDGATFIAIPQTDLDLLVQLVKPAHTLVETRYVIEEATDDIAEDLLFELLLSLFEQDVVVDITDLILNTAFAVGGLSVQWFDDSASTLNDKTSEAHLEDSSTTGSIMDDSADFLYVGLIDKFTEVLVILSTVAVSAGSLTMEYYNGTAFMAVSGLTDGTDSGGNTFAQDGSIAFMLPTDWATGADAVQVGLNSGHFYIRFSFASSPSTAPDADQVSPANVMIERLNITGETLLGGALVEDFLFETLFNGSPIVL